MDAHANFCTFLPTSAPTCLISGPLAEILPTFAPASSGGRKGGQSTLVVYLGIYVLVHDDCCLLTYYVEVALEILACEDNS